MPLPNPPVSVDALMAPVDAASVQSTWIDALVTMRVRADLWPQEDAAYATIVTGSTIIAGQSADRIAATKAGWLPTSSGDWLAWLALYMYGVTKVVATFATGPLKLTNNGGGSFSFAPFTAVFQNAVTKRTYTNVDAISLASGPGTTQTINVQASEIGSASNATPGEVTGIVTTMLAVSCTNLAPILGIDDQTDESLQLACWNSIAANSFYGPPQSFGYAVQTATNAVTGAPVNINRWRPPSDSHTGQLTLFVASPGGIPDPNDVIGVSNRINAVARPPGVVVTVMAPILLPYTAALVVYVTSTPGLQASTVQTRVENALASFFAAYPIGGRTGASSVEGLFASAIQGVCSSAWPGVFEITGAIDMVMGANGVAVDETTVQVVLVAP